MTRQARGPQTSMIFRGRRRTECPVKFSIGRTRVSPPSAPPPTSRFLSLCAAVYHPISTASVITYQRPRYRTALQGATLRVQRNGILAKGRFAAGLSRVRSFSMFDAVMLRLRTFLGCHTSVLFNFSILSGGYWKQNFLKFSSLFFLITILFSDVFYFSRRDLAILWR